MLQPKKNYNVKKSKKKKTILLVYFLFAYFSLHYCLLCYCFREATSVNGVILVLRIQSVLMKQVKKCGRGVK